MEIEARGAPAHTRTLSVGLFHQDDAHWTARGAIIDLRKRGLVPMAGDIQTNGFIHHMKVDADVARDGLRLESIVAEQPTVAFEPSAGTGGECCRDPRRNIEALAGSRADAGYARRLGAAIGGPRGCSHVLTLAQLLGSTLRSADETDRDRFGATPPRTLGQRLFQRSLSIDGLEDGERGLSLSLQLADVHFAPIEAVEDPIERLAGQREIRVHAAIDLGSMQVGEIAAAERVSTARDYQDAAWQPRDVSFLAGHPALGGMAKTLFTHVGDTPEQRPLLDALLNLAPTVIQCIPSLTNHWRRWREASAQEGTSRVSMMAGGGMADSCYMWRRGGFMDGRMDRTLPTPRK